MTKKSKYLLSIILVLMMIVTSVYLPEKPVMASTDSDWANSSTVLPDDVDWKNIFDFRVNMKLYREKQIIVYGNYSNVPNNDYKEVDGGYYEGGYGEYRYHGFLYNGTPYVNADFPVDSGMTHPFDYYYYMKIEDWGTKSDYNIKAIGNDKISAEETEKTQNTIKHILVNSYFNSSGIVPNNASHSLSVDAWDYANVLSYPSENTKGAVQFRHKRIDLPSSSIDHNSEWYLSLETEPFITDKIILDGLLTASLTGSLDLTSIKPNEDYTMTLTIGGDLDDIISQGKDLKLYYTGQDIISWNYILRNTVSGEKKTGTVPANGTRHMDKAIQIMTISSDYIKERNENTTESGKIDLGNIFEVTVYANFSNPNGPAKIQDTATYNPSVPSPAVEEEPEPVVKPEPDLKLIEPDIEAPKDMLDTEKFHIIDKTDRTNVVNIDVTIDGRKLSESEENNFLNENHLFPLIGNGELYNYEITFHNELGKTFKYRSYVIVHSTKPYGNIDIIGKFKENRKLTAYNDSYRTNDPYVMERSRLVVDNFNIVGSEVYIDKNNNNNVSFLVKQYDSQVKAVLDQHIVIDSNYIERSDIPFSYHRNSSEYDFYVLKDYEPCIVSNIWNPVLSRVDNLDYSLNITSTDADKISVKTYKIYYDGNEDGYYEKLVKSGNVDDFSGYSPNKLGSYKIVYYAEEELLGETIPRFISEADKRSSTDEYFFTCKNLAPSTQIYIDIPQNYPKVDVVILNDRSLERDEPSTNTDIKASKVDFTNTLIRDSLNSYVYVWDTYTYVYTQDGTRKEDTGRIYPSKTLSVSENGYNGVLELDTSKGTNGVISDRETDGYYDTETSTGVCVQKACSVLQEDGTYDTEFSISGNPPSGATTGKTSNSSGGG